MVVMGVHCDHRLHVLCPTSRPLLRPGVGSRCQGNIPGLNSETITSIFALGSEIWGLLKSINSHIFKHERKFLWQSLTSSYFFCLAERESNTTRDSEAVPGVGGAKLLPGTRAVGWI